jgi:hypothetical protein
MTIDSFDTLVRAVVAASESRDWQKAVGEWEVIELEEDPAGEGVCVCGQTNLVKLFTIKNRLNGSTLYPIGSVCVNKFEQEVLDRQVDLFSALIGLRSAIREGKDVTLTSEFFTRAMLEYFLFNDAFLPDQWNGNDGENDYEFLLKMFNKRDKDAITDPQQRKIYMLLNRKIVPFVLSDPRLK